MTWIPLNQLANPLQQRNLQAFSTRHPALLRVLLEQSTRNDIRIESVNQTLYRAKRMLPDGEEAWVDLGGDEQQSIQRFMNGFRGYRPDSGWTFLLGIGAGNTLRFFTQWRFETKPLVIVERDPALLLAACSLLDLTPLIASSAVHWVIGADCVERLEQILQEDLFPFFLLSAAHTSLPGELVEAHPFYDECTPVIDRLFAASSRRIETWIEEFKQHYADYGSKPVERVNVLVFQQGCWETLGMGLAEGFEQNGVDALVTRFRSLGDTAAILRANIDVLRHKPDAIAVIDFPTSPFFFDLVNNAPIPRLVWIVDDVINLPQCSFNPFDLAFPVDDTLHPDIVAMGGTIGGDVPLSVSPNIRSQLKPELECGVSFVGSVFDSQPIRETLPQSLIEKLDRIIEIKLGDFKKPPLELLRENPFEPHERERLLQTLRQSIAKTNMSDEVLIRYYFNLEFNRARRTSVIAALSAFHVSVYGSADWAKALEPVGLAHLYQGRGTTMQEGFDLYRSSKVNINIHTMFPHASPNERDFEVPLSGGFLISDLIMHTQDRTENFFAVGKELVIYRTLDELQAQVEHYLSKPDERETIIHAAKERILSQHTMRHRVRQMMDCLA